MRKDHTPYPMCKFAGRRLEEAWPHVQDTCKTWRERANHLPPEATEGNARVHGFTSAMIKQLAAMVLHRNKYLGVPPWSFSLVLTVEGAKTCMQHVRARPLEEHDVLTRYLVSTQGGHMDARARGRTCTPI